MMILMHDSAPYGYLALKGSPIDPAVIARRTGCDSLAQYETLLAELDYAGVPSRTSSGILYSRRMVRDARRRAEDRLRKQKQRQVESRQQNCHALVTAPVTALSQPSSSSSSIAITKKTKTSVPRAFDSEDAWLKRFLESTRLIEFREGERQALMDPDWWEIESVACNGINLQFLESEFAKMGLWLTRNKRRRPTKRFVSNWLQKAAERREEYGG
jgi:hypothetical protein